MRRCTPRSPSAGTRRTSSPSLTRALALEVGRLARDAATASLTSVLSPLPHYRGQPSALIASIVVAMARNLDLADAEVERIRTAALLHDVGKVGLPQDILDKPAALSAAEWRTVVQHPRIGQVILEQAAALKEAVPIILHHHERYSGHGYPFGLRANDIPLGARIVSIADAYDAMIHDRPYKRAMSHEMAIEELRRHSGTQFDPQLVTLFCDLFAQHAPTADPALAAITAPLHAAADQSTRAPAGTPAGRTWAAGTSAAVRNPDERVVVDPGARSAMEATGVANDRRGRRRRLKTAPDAPDLLSVVSDVSVAADVSGVPPATESAAG